MSKNQTIFAVKINDMSAELEIDNSKIKCITGNTVHFEALLSDLRSCCTCQIKLNFVEFLPKKSTSSMYHYIKALSKCYISFKKYLKL